MERISPPVGMNVLVVKSVGPDVLYARHLHWYPAVLDRDDVLPHDLGGVPANIVVPAKYNI